jgi:uncharacterized membrane protein YozB (DUF420 family)
MNQTLRLVGFGTLSLFGVLIGLYPVLYFINGDAIGFIGTKGALAQDTLWNIAFYAHITGGGIALLTGWIQFWKKFRDRNIQLHRNIGKAYLIAILLLGAPGGIYTAFFANGGFANALGFGMLGILWFFTTLKAYTTIRKKEVEAHKNWMTRSYALAFAAVTLRLYMPFFIGALGVNPEEAYAAVAWVCWVPNLILAEYFIQQNYVRT